MSSRRIRLRELPSRPKVMPAVVVQAPDLRAWRLALALADGDLGRLEVLEDGAVLVRNVVAPAPLRRPLRS